MALNTTGKPNTNNYFLGRGVVYLARIDTVTGLPLAFRDMGNCPAFSIAMTLEELLHKSSRHGLKVTDKRVIISQSIGFKFSLDELEHANLALALVGSITSDINPAVVGFAERTLQDNTLNPVLEASWYDVRNTAGTRVSIGDVTKLTVKIGAATLVLNTHYEVDKKMGRIFIKEGTTVGGNLLVTMAADATAPAFLDKVEALAGSNVDYALKFVGENPANNDEPLEFHFHSVNIGADGDTPLIGDEYAVLQFSGTAQVQSQLAKTLTITSLGS